MRTCSVDGCDRPHRAKGLCAFHYYRQRDGVPLDAPLSGRGSRGRRCCRDGCTVRVFRADLCLAHFRAVMDCHPGEPRCVCCHRPLQVAQEWQPGAFCSKACQEWYYNHFGALPTSGHRFECKECGRTVVTGDNDRRTVFCSVDCERRFWRRARAERRQRQKHNISLWQIRAEAAENERLMSEAEDLATKGTP